MSQTIRYVNHENDILVLVEAPYGLVTPDTIVCQYREGGKIENPLRQVTLSYNGIQGYK